MPLAVVPIGLGAALGWYVAAMFGGIVIGWHDAGNGAYRAVWDAAEGVASCGGVLGASIAIWLIVGLRSRQWTWLGASLVIAVGLVFTALANRLLDLPAQS